MLLSLLLELRALESSPILGPLGPAGRGLFLRQVTRIDPKMASRLHDQESGSRKVLRPYTVSTLLDRRGLPIPPGTWLQPRQPCWLRITSLTSELSELILARLAPGLPGRVELNKMPFRVEGATCDPAQHPWAAKSSYQDLHAACAMSDWRSVQMQFVAPTAFRQHGRDLPLPLPRQVIAHFLERWNAFGPEALSLNEDFVDFCDQCLVVSSLKNLNTERWEFRDRTRGAATGFTGEVELTLQRAEKSRGWAEVWEGAPQVLNLLAAYGFYCGVGHHTAVGMGQARVKPRRSSRAAADVSGDEEGELE